MKSRLIAYLAAVCTTTLSASQANAQALRTGLERLHEARVGKVAANAFHEFIFSSTTTALVFVGLAAAVFLFSRGHRRSAVFLAAASSAIILCRYLSEIVTSPTEFGIYIILPLFLLAIVIRLCLGMKQDEEEDDDDRRDKVRERRPRTLKVRGVLSDDDEESRKRIAPVKLNRPFGRDAF